MVSSWNASKNNTYPGEHFQNSCPEWDTPGSIITYAVAEKVLCVYFIDHFEWKWKRPKHIKIIKNN